MQKKRNVINDVNEGKNGRDANEGQVSQPEGKTTGQNASEVKRKNKTIQ